jgi:hypothetical protein
LDVIKYYESQIIIDIWSYLEKFSLVVKIWIWFVNSIFSAENFSEHLTIFISRMLVILVGMTSDPPSPPT